MGCHKCEVEKRMQTNKKNIWFVPLDHCVSCDQPERSKREDSLIRDLLENSAVDFSKLKDEPPYPLIWDKDLNFVGHKIIEEMRCSEHDGNIVRDK